MQAHTRIDKCELKDVSHVNSWRCDSNNQSIPSTYVCDGSQNCKNGEDEEKILCEGDPKWQIYLGIFIALNLFLGLISYLIGEFFRINLKLEEGLALVSIRIA